jgi:hypothetical protein
MSATLSHTECAAFDPAAAWLSGSFVGKLALDMLLDVNCLHFWKQVVVLDAAVKQYYDTQTCNLP